MYVFCLSETHSVVTLSLLDSAKEKSSGLDPGISVALEEQTEPEEVPTVSCDKCDKKAVCYCTECDWKFCPTHEEVGTG